MINIGLISHASRLHGAERMLLNLALLLLETEKFSVKIFMPEMDDSGLYSECKKYGIEAESIPFNIWYIFFDRANENEFKQRKELIRIRTKEFDKIIRNNNIDIFINNTLTNIIPYMSIIKFNIPIITWVHGILDGFVVPNGDLDFRLLLDRVCMSLSSSVICNSIWTEKYFHEYSKNMTVIYNWTNEPKNIDNVDKENIFVCLNSLHHLKGIYKLINACKILKNRGYSFKLLLYGNDLSDMIEQLKEEIEKSDLSENVILKGVTSNIESVYNNSSILVQPSYIESFGMTIIEAMSYGNAVISSRSGGPEEIINHNVDGLLVDRFSPEDLAEKMMYLLDNKDEAIRMGREGRKSYVNKFSSKVASSKFIDVITKTHNSFSGYTNEQMIIYDMLKYIF
ncbi:MAG: hypothetical protein A2Y24_06710 [Clostridiales bacterium GWE2_32_10]|nr:MAG: hypothetical protein A2Y24_06710 [Clostridiales bacterium GWE2_32_10]HBY19864.1 hypothetical protein [Clostridiales bacterium]